MELTFPMKWNDLPAQVRFPGWDVEHACRSVRQPRRPKPSDPGTQLRHVAPDLAATSKACVSPSSVAHFLYGFF